MIEQVELVQPSAVVPSLWPGATVVIIGGGSSLTLKDVDYVGVRASARRLERRHLQSEEPEIRVIAIKEAVELAPWADCLYAADDKWWSHHKGYPFYAGLKYCIEPQRWAWPDVQILRNTGTDGLEDDPSGLRTGYNSGYQAIGLAKHLGAAKAVLLGFDCWRGPDGRQNWFDKPGLHVDSPYPIFLQAFGTIAEPLKRAGVQVVNASRFTMLRAFPQMTLSEALA